MSDKLRITILSNSDIVQTYKYILDRQTAWYPQGLDIFLQRIFEGKNLTEQNTAIPPLVPLALHVVSFVSLPVEGTITGNDINIPREKFEAVLPKLMDYLGLLQILAILIGAVRVIEKDQPQVPLTNVSDSPQIDSGKQNINFTELLEKLEKIQVNELKKIDKMFPVDAKNMVRCLTWIVEINGSDEEVIAPYATCIPDQDFHVMYYNIFRPVQNRNRILKVVVENFLCEIPFEVIIPENLMALTVVIIAIPIFDQTQEQPVQGVKIMLYSDPYFEITAVGLPMNTDESHPTVVGSTIPTNTAEILPTVIGSTTIPSNPVSKMNSDQSEDMEICEPKKT